VPIMIALVAAGDQHGLGPRCPAPIFERVLGEGRMALQFLVVDGNPREAREKHEAEFGKTSAGSYVELLKWLEPAAACVVLNGADGGPAEADGELARFDAVVITGSQLHVQEMSPEVTRQLDLMRAVFRAEVPAFGSCWGVQVAGTVAGGEARRNPKGPEYGFARRLAPVNGGLQHPLLRGRPPPATRPPSTSTLWSHRQRIAMSWPHDPELDLFELSVMLRLMASDVVAEGLCSSEAEVLAHAEKLQALHAEPKRADLAWRHGLDAEVIDPIRRTREIRNFIDDCVKPTKSAHGRA
jgi:GMP synthase (glutamine-hydrolysing)